MGGSRLRLHFRSLRDEGGGCVITGPRLKKSGGSLINGAFAASIALRIVTASTSRRVIAFSVHRRRIVISASIGLGNGQRGWRTPSRVDNKGERDDNDGRVTR